MCWLLLTLILSMYGSTMKLSTTSATDNLNTAHYYNHNFYAIDESRIWQHSTDFNNADYTADVNTATSDPFPLPTIYPLYSKPSAQHPHFYHIAPYPVYSQFSIHKHLPQGTNCLPFLPHYPPFQYYALPSSGHLPCPSATRQSLSPFCC